jgi:hypothetical protein
MERHVHNKRMNLLSGCIFIGNIKNITGIRMGKQEKPVLFSESYPGMIVFPGGVFQCAQNHKRGGDDKL